MFAGTHHNVYCIFSFSYFINSVSVLKLERPWTYLKMEKKISISKSFCNTNSLTAKSIGITIKPNEITQESERRKIVRIPAILMAPTSNKLSGYSTRPDKTYLRCGLQCCRLVLCHPLWQSKHKTSEHPIIYITIEIKLFMNSYYIVTLLQFVEIFSSFIIS